MRIIGGKYKGFRFAPHKKNPARPTTDIAKEGLFNILNNAFYFDELAVLDLFGGTGSISYEFASRGCENITTIEQDRKLFAFILGMVQQKEMPIKPIRADVFKFIKKCNTQFNLIFAGPPYPLPNLDQLPKLIFQYDLLHPQGWFILEHNPNHDFKDHPHFWKKRQYGTTIFSIFVKEDKIDEV